MKNFFLSTFALICGFLASCGEKTGNTQTKVKEYNKGINIIPQPQSLVQNQGSFKLTGKTVFFASTDEEKTIAAFFASKIATSTGYSVEVKDQKPSGSTISLLTDASLDVNDEGYTLDVTEKEVTVKAKTPQGLFYGMQTFMQLLPAEIESANLVEDVSWTVPCVAVKDEPRFDYRGIMFDVCRHFIPVETLKKQLDVLALFKINRMHWHLTEDQGWRIEIKKYPKLIEVGSVRKEANGVEYGGFYTQEDVKEIVAYAAERFITVVPEIELPGHELAAIAAYPELSCKGEPVKPRTIWGVEDIVLCPGKESVFEFLEDVIAEVVPLFPGEYFHIGGDECPKTSWKECPLCQKRIREEGLKDEYELQSYVIRRIGKVLEQHGKKMIGWDEILEGGLAPSAIVMSWRGEAGGIEAASMEHEVIMTPGGNGMYFDTFQGDPKIEPVAIGGYTLLEKVYKYNPVPDTLANTNKGHFVKGVQCNIWSEYMYNTDIMEYRVYPRLLALSEIAWTALGKKDFTDFSRRINNGYVRLDGHGINYHIPQPEQPHGSCDFVAFTDKANLTFKTTRPVKMVYTLDKSEPTPQSTVYETPLEIAETTTLKIRSVLPSGRMSPIRTITVEKQTPAPAKEITSKKSGLAMQVTDGVFLESSHLEGIKEWRTSVIKKLKELTSVVKSNESMREVKQYAAIAQGYVQIPEDGVYYFSSDLEEVWINGSLLVNNGGEVKRFSRKDRSVALSKGLHEIKAVFLGNSLGGWPSNWNDGSIKIRKAGSDKFELIQPEQLYHK